MADDICQKNAIQTVDRIVLTVEKSIGIEDIRNLQKNILFTPLKSPMKAAIIYHAETMTTDAQNAFLKTLEEPPPHTLILLLAKNKEYFLQTIISRCSIIQQKTVTETQDTNEHDLFFNSIFTLCTVDILLCAQMYGKTKESAIAWIEQTMHLLRKEMIQTHKKEHTVMLRRLQKTYILLSNTNANPRLALEHTFLDIL